MPTKNIISTKVVCRIGMFRFAMKKFEAEVNRALGEGYCLSQDGICFQKVGLLKYFVKAVLYKYAA
jgi:hypothetical protein